MTITLGLSSILYTGALLLLAVAFFAGAQYGKRAALGGYPVKAKLRKDIVKAREAAQADLKQRIAELKKQAEAEQEVQLQ